MSRAESMSVCARPAQDQARKKSLDREGNTGMKSTPSQSYLQLIPAKEGKTQFTSLE